jgi:hypothetical protein
MKFQEYLDRNKKLVTSPAVKQVIDYEGTVVNKPAKEKKHKDAGGKGQIGEPKSYKVGTDAKDPNKGKMSDGFAEKGNKELKVNMPNGWYGSGGKGTVKDENGVPGGKRVAGDLASSMKNRKKAVAKTTKTPTQEWIDRTKNMSLAEFTKKIHNEALNGLDECDCQDTHSTVKNTVDLCKCNNKYVSALVREMKRNGLFESLVEEMINHRETFQAFAEFMEADESVARKLVKAINEMVAPPVGDPADDEAPSPKKQLPSPDMNDDDHDDMGDDEDHDHDDMGDEGDDLGDDDNQDMGGEDEDEDEDEMGHPKLHAHHHLMNAIKDHPALSGKW